MGSSVTQLVSLLTNLFIGVIRDAIKFAEHFYKQNDVIQEDDCVPAETQTSNDLLFPVLKSSLIEASK